MKIYVNGRFLTQKITGINRFAYEITKRLSNLTDISVIIPKGKLNSSYDIKDLNIIEFGHLASHLWEQISLSKFLHHKKDYLLLNFSGLGPVIIKNKIVTIHDLSFIYNPSWFSKTYYYIYKILTPLTIKTSKRIFTVSNFSKLEITKHYQVSPSKIDVIYNAVSELKKNNPKHHRIPENENIILTVGSLDPRKNFNILLDVFNDVRLKHTKLHIVGDINKIFNNKINQQNLSPNIKFLGRISDKELIEEYSNASLFVLPSLYEGFGIPPLEALTYGCPIAISDIPVFHEIFGQSADYFDPKNKEDIVNTILKRIKKRNWNSNVVKQTLNRYSWEASAENVLSSLHNVQNETCPNYPHQ